ncbi:MAG: hypothetical protein ABR915_20290 [Thermoguttaceae bacterium]|jgi:hypothetical protein
MIHKLFLLLIAGSLPLGLPAGSSAAGPQSQEHLPAEFQKLLPLHTKLGPPRPGGWLAQHKEPGQSYLYVRPR